MELCGQMIIHMFSDYEYTSNESPHSEYAPVDKVVSSARFSRSTLRSKHKW